jgi:hypothetical protein
MYQTFVTNVKRSHHEGYCECGDFLPKKYIKVYGNRCLNCKKIMMASIKEIWKLKNGRNGIPAKEIQQASLPQVSGGLQHERGGLFMRGGEGGSEGKGEE